VRIVVILLFSFGKDLPGRQVHLFIQDSVPLALELISQ
jgi:hypothetical protein